MRQLDWLSLGACLEAVGQRVCAEGQCKGHVLAAVRDRGRPLVQAGAEEPGIALPGRSGARHINNQDHHVPDAVHKQHCKISALILTREPLQ